MSKNLDFYSDLEEFVDQVNNADAELVILMKSLVQKFGAQTVVDSTVEACDIVADESSDKEGHYWRDASSKLMDVSTRLQEFKKTSKQNP